MTEMVVLAAGIAIGLAIAELRERMNDGDDSEDVLDELCSALEDPAHLWRASFHTLDCASLGISVWIDGAPSLWRPQRVAFSRAGRRRLRSSMKIAADNALVAAVDKQRQQERLDT